MFVGLKWGLQSLPNWIRCFLDSQMVEIFDFAKVRSRGEANQLGRKEQRKEDQIEEGFIAGFSMNERSVFPMCFL